VLENNRKNAKLSKSSKGLGEPKVIGEQPDLLKETIRKESKRELDIAASAQKAARWNADGFNMMAVVAGYFIQRSEVSEKKVDDFMVQLKEAQAEKGRSLEELESQLSQSFQQERSQWNQQLEQVKEAKEAQCKEDRKREEEIAQLTQQLQVAAEKQQQLENSTKQSLEQLETRLRDEASQQTNQLTEQLRAQHADERSVLLAQAETEKEQLREQLTQTAAEAERTLREQWDAERVKLREELAHEQQQLVEKGEAAAAATTCSSGTNSVGSTGSLKKTKKTAGTSATGYKLEAERERAGRLEQEVESLRTVLEMKTEELHASRLSRIKLEERLTELEQKEDAWRKANALVEDLKEQLAARFEVERRLVVENRSLCSIMEKEHHEKKRLSMENEQLTWKIKQECEGMSRSFCEGVTDYSLPSALNFRTSFGSGGRPGSAPPTKLGGGPTSLPCHAPLPFTEDGQSGPPHSPRVLEIVEKVESVAWKLEYDLPESSPRVARKISPQSPLYLRKCKSSGLMTRSLDRTNMLTRSNSSPTNNALTLANLNSPTSPLLKRSTSIRRKVSPPQFETLNEFTDESDESRKTSPDEHRSSGGGGDCASGVRSTLTVVDTRAVRAATPTRKAVLEQPDPIDIGLFEDDMCEISSSSEIEVGDPDSLNTDTTDSDLGVAYDHHHHLHLHSHPTTHQPLRQSAQQEQHQSRAAAAAVNDNLNNLSLSLSDHHQPATSESSSMETGGMVVSSPTNSELHSPVTEMTLRSGLLSRRNAASNRAVGGNDDSSDDEDERDAATAGDRDESDTDLSEASSCSSSEEAITGQDTTGSINLDTTQNVASTASGNGGSAGAGSGVSGHSLVSGAAGGKLNTSLPSYCLTRLFKQPTNAGAAGGGGGDPTDSSDSDF